jgi:hypothetical protein
MKLDRPQWWTTTLPWRALKLQSPVTTMKPGKVTGIIIHKQGQFGLNRGDWVNGDRSGKAFHRGLDVIGWIGEDGLNPLDKRTVCCSPLHAIVLFVGPDQHGHPSVVLRHSSPRAERIRFSFFGDLEEVYVKEGQEIAVNTSLGLPCRFRGKYRFFHFGIGYEISRNGKSLDSYVNPRSSLEVKVAVQGRMPWI